jgi:hypothetical protein
MARTLYYKWEHAVSDYGLPPATPGGTEPLSAVAYALPNPYPTGLLNEGFPWH